MEGGKARRGRGWHVVAALLLTAALWLINVQPGWQSVEGLTAEFALLLGVINITLALGVLSHVLDFVQWPSVLVRSLCDAALATAALVSLARLLVLFPFGVADGGGRIMVRGVIAAALIGAFVGLVASLGAVARSLHVNSHLQGRRRRR